MPILISISMSLLCFAVCKGFFSQHLAILSLPFSIPSYLVSFKLNSKAQNSLHFRHVCQACGLLCWQQSSTALHLLPAWNLRAPSTWDSQVMLPSSQDHFHRSHWYRSCSPPDEGLFFLLCGLFCLSWLLVAPSNSYVSGSTKGSFHRSHWYRSGSPPD